MALFQRVRIHRYINFEKVLFENLLRLVNFRNIPGGAQDILKDLLEIQNEC